MRLVLLFVVFLLSACGKTTPFELVNPFRITHTPDKYNPQDATITCPNGQVTRAATLSFWQNGDVKGIHMDCHQVVVR